RVAERAEHVEHRPHAELPPARSRVAEGGMKDRREEEPDPRALDATRDALRRQVDLDAELLEDVGRAAHRRGRAVPMLGDSLPTRRGDNGRERRDVEGCETVAAGTAGVEQR